MASVYRIDRDVSLGSQLLNLLERMSSDFAQLKNLRLAMIQQRDGDGSAASNYSATAILFGYLTASGGPDTGSTAQASFEEIDAFVGNGGPSLEQCAARHRQ